MQHQNFEDKKDVGGYVLNSEFESPKFSWMKECEMGELDMKGIKEIRQMYVRIGMYVCKRIYKSMYIDGCRVWICIYVG